MLEKLDLSSCTVGDQRPVALVQNFFCLVPRFASLSVICQSVDLDLHSRSQACLKLHLFCFVLNWQYPGQYLSYDIQAWNDGRRKHGFEHDLEYKNVCNAYL